MLRGASLTHLGDSGGAFTMTLGLGTIAVQMTETAQHLESDIRAEMRAT